MEFSSSMISIISICEEGSFHGLNSFEVNIVELLDDELEWVSESESLAIRDEEVSYWLQSCVVWNVHENCLLVGIKHGEMVSELVVPWESHSLEVQERPLSSRDMNFDGVSRHCFGNEHVMVGHDDAISCIKCNLFSLEEVIWVVKMNILIPPLLGLLVTLEVWVMGQEHSGLDILFVVFCWESGWSPWEIEDIVLKILPGGTKIFGIVKLLVDLAWLIVSKVGAWCPTSCQGPCSLGWMELKLMNFFSWVESSQICSTIFGYPVYTMGSYYKNFD